MTTPRKRSAFGRLLLHWRGLRGKSQLALAQEVETTTRHLSYVENGRSRPGRDLVLRLAEALDLPLRSRNELLEAAGLAAEFSQSELGGELLLPYRRAVLGVMDAVNPYPAFAMDAAFNLKEANASARKLLSGLSDAAVSSLPESNSVESKSADSSSTESHSAESHSADSSSTEPNLTDSGSTEGPPLNLVDAFLAPGPARALIVNFAEVAWSWHQRLVRASLGHDVESSALAALRERVLGYLREVPRPAFDGAGEPVMCPTFRIGEQLVRTIGMTMRFGPSRDVTLDELTVDLLYPRDAASEAFFRALSVTA